MNAQDILQARLVNQHLVGSKFTSPDKAVGWFGAVQSQDYTGAKWAVGQRMENGTNEILEHAFNNGQILRTHVMRPTWHFIHPKDARWMLQLTGPNISKMMTSYNKKLELTADVFKKAQKEFIKMLVGKNALTRQELKKGLTQIGITTDVQRLAHLVMQAEIDQIVISGPMKGKQFTYMLFDERISETTKSLTKDEALSELVKRYFQSHGPATIHDFAWWSGLTMIDSKKGITMTSLNTFEFDNKTYYYTKLPKHTPKTSKIFLLPNYDEYGIAYKNRELFIPKEIRERPQQFGALPYPHIIIKDGILIGMWKRIPKATGMQIQPSLFHKANSKIASLLEITAKEYSSFLSVPVTIKD